MSSSDDDMPLARPNASKSQAAISKSVDKAMDTATSKMKPLPEAISLRGPETMDLDPHAPTTNGKRKSRGSIAKTYKESSGEDSDDAIVTSNKRRKVRNGDSEQYDNAPMLNRAKIPPKNKLNASSIPTIASDSDDDRPLGQKLADKKVDIEKKAAQEAKAIASKKKSVAKKRAKNEDSDDEPIVQTKRKANGKKANGVKKEESDSDAPLIKKTTPKKTKVKAEPSTAAAKKGKGKAVAKEEGTPEEEEEEEYRWWDAPKEDDSIKWTTLQHSGVVFPPPYEPLPKNVKLIYDGKPMNLSIEAEEVAGFFGAMLNSTHNVENPTFQKNFFGDFQEILKKTGGAKDRDGNKVPIKEFNKLDFSKIFEYYTAKNDARKARSSAEKKAETAAKNEAEAPYIHCTWDGRKEKVGNFRVEPPGLFRGRGQHPKTGKVKARVMPEQITINIGKEATVPSPPEGHTWKEIKHDNKATWLAMWQENINGNYKYVMLAANSAIKGQSDYKKFEKARQLKEHIETIRKDYTKDLRSEMMADRQRATAMYLIDKLALRAGNEKDTENEAETVGCCSLKFEHVSLKLPNIVIFDFLGKDSIRFYDEVAVDQQVFKNIKIFKKAPKKEGDDIFDRLNTSQLNKHLASYMPGLTAKVFRTYNASFTMSTLLKDLKNSKDMPMAEKIKLYNDCNREVAILCNHKRTVGASHEAAMEKMEDKIKGLKYQKWRTKQMMIDVDDKIKKKKGAKYFELDEDLDEEWIQEHQAFLVQEVRTKIEKKFAKENEKLVAEGKKEMKPKELTERLAAAAELEAKFARENKTRRVAAEGKGASVEKLAASVAKIDQRIATMALQAEDREGNKEVALGTSKINYIDPRLTVVFAKRFEVPLEKFFSKTLREKFNWAIKSVDTDEWEF